MVGWQEVVINGTKMTFKVEAKVKGLVKMVRKWYK